MRSIDEAGVCRGLDRHRRAFAIGAEEHQPPPGRGGDLAQHAARFQAVFDAGVGRVQRAREHPMLGALAGLAQVDQQDVGLAETLDRLARGQRQALTVEVTLAGTATSIILGLGSFRPAISAT
jgi:hypothetical protein